ncbi:band 7 protein AGAP004871 isoform X2 [Temnothorax americanus]|uniref:band 7 protein AGAP004871 isoform X2 n=2 Tax=Temnothorax americanus TaxID=1964332 RepID=UPI004067FE98
MCHQSLGFRAFISLAQKRCVGRASEVARFESRVNPTDIPMATMSNSNGSTMQINTRPDDIRKRIIGYDSAQSDSTTCGNILVVLSWIVVILTMPFSLFVCFKVVQEYERAVIFRLGRLLSGGAKGPGIFFILPCIDNYARVDLRTRTYDVPPQEVLTKDSVTVSVDAVVYYRVNNATISIANVENAHHSTRLLAQTTLRNTMGTRPLHEILSERETISGNMQVSLDEATDTWGIKVERVEIKDVRLPVQLQRAMAAEAEAAREARAKVIAAEGEQKASRALREASEVIGDSPAALQLRYLQTLNTISAEKNSTIVFPLPIDMMTYFLKSHANKE